MAPQARLTFTPSTAPVSPAPFDLSSLNSFALWPSSPSPANTTAPLLPSRPAARTPPTVQVTGNFSLEKGGGVQVGSLKGLWWMGQGNQEEMGVWELQLLRATDADALAVHRLLLYLPPARPRSRSPSQQIPAYRNSLLLYDHHYQRIVSVLPLDEYSPPRQRPARGPLPPLPTSRPLPNPPSRPLSPGAQLARYVDRVVEGIHPDPTPDSLSAAERLEQAKTTREACKEEKEWDPFQLGDILLAVPPAGTISGVSEQDSTEEEVEPGKEKEEVGESTSSLNSETANLAPSTSKARSIRSRVAPSERSVSSFATFGSVRFVTADEFEDATGTSRRSSFATILEASEHSSFASTIREMQEANDEGYNSEEEDERTPTPTKIVDPSPGAPPAGFASSLDTSAHPPSLVLDPEHTLTNGNAVLLSFLGASSIGPSSSNRIRVSTHPLSADQVSEQIEAGSIEPAEMDVGEGEEEKGWLSWLTSLLRSGREEGKGDSTVDLKTKGWLGWLPWLWSEQQPSLSSDAPDDPPQAKGYRDRPPLSNPKTSAAPSNSPSSSRNPVRQFGRASGENTSRLSVLYVDGEGRGSKAFVG
ncbi:hypothetical protein JCM5353_000291 [Sporobolomyces roseus]